MLPPPPPQVQTLLRQCATASHLASLNVCAAPASRLVHHTLEGPAAHTAHTLQTSKNCWGHPCLAAVYSR